MLSIQCKIRRDRPSDRPVDRDRLVGHPWYRWLDLKYNPMDSSPFENNFPRTINCPATRANVNEPSRQRTDWRYHCST